MQVLSARLDLKVEVADAPKSIGETGLALSQPVVVTYTHVVNIAQECVLSLGELNVQVLTSRLLHALEAELNVDRHLLAKLLVRLDGIYPVQDRALVVR